MSTRAALLLSLPDEAATDRLAEALADTVTPGDTILLEGPVGAGKSHVARALIRARLGFAGDIPSPSFTLVQTYEGREGEIWHADLYRLSHPDELVELGLEAALGRAVCLIEWPDRMGTLAPPDALRLALSHAGAGREARVTGGVPGRLEALAGRLRMAET